MEKWLSVEAVVSETVAWHSERIYKSMSYTLHQVSMQCKFSQLVHSLSISIPTHITELMYNRSTCSPVEPQ